jgi:hypothetical protein
VVINKREKRGEKLRFREECYKKNCREIKRRISIIRGIGG